MVLTVCFGHECRLQFRGGGDVKDVDVKDVSTSGTGVEGVWCVQAMRSRDRDRCFGDDCLAGGVWKKFMSGYFRVHACGHFLDWLLEPQGSSQQPHCFISWIGS